IGVARRGIDEDEMVDRLRPGGREVLRDEAAKRNPCDVRARYFVPGKQFAKLRRQIFDRVSAGRNWRAPVTRQIVRDQRKVACEIVSEIPEMAVHAETMQQNERRTRAAPL